VEERCGASSHRDKKKERDTSHELALVQKTNAASRAETGKFQYVTHQELVLSLLTSKNYRQRCPLPTSFAHDSCDAVGASVLLRSSRGTRLVHEGRR
jgi:hypothetical protein